MVAGRWIVHLECAVEGLGRAQLFFCDLVTNRAGDSVFGSSVVLVIGIERKVREDLRFAALALCLQVDDGHMTDRALILYGRLRLRMIDGFAPHTGLPVRV